MDYREVEIITISAIFASRLRPDMLIEALNNFRQTTQGQAVEIIVVIDDDPISYERLNGHSDILLYSAYRWGAVGCWNRGLKLASGDIIFAGSDDVRYEEGWLDKALLAHRNKLDGYGMVGLNDCIHNGNVLATVVLFDRQFCKDHLGGVISCPHYHHLFADNERDARAKRTGRFYWCAEAVTRHDHPSTGSRPPDENDARRESVWAIDEQTYKQRAAAGFPDDFEPMI